MEEYLKDREEQLHKVNKLMVGIHGIAKDIGAEVKVHSHKIQNIEIEMKGAEDNVGKGTDELS